MIQHASFLGISLRTLAHRRALVTAYYVLLVGLAALPVVVGKPMNATLILQTFMLGTLFGGIKSGGPVKSFTETPPPTDRELLTTLHLDARPTPPRVWLLDERERHQRDRAHYIAYRLLILLLAVILAVSGAAQVLFKIRHEPFLEHNALTLLWLLAVVGLSLPQSVILWTEPEPLADAELHLVRH